MTIKNFFSNETFTFLEIFYGKDAFRMKKDYNTVIPLRKAMFRHLNKAIFVQFLKSVCNAVTVAMAMIQRF